MGQQSEGRAERKPLDAQVVGKTNAAALKALSDTGARHKWAETA